MQESMNAEILEAIQSLDSKWNNKLQGISDELSKMVRRIEEVNNNLTLIYQDRELLEEIQQNITALREGIHMSREHNERVVKDVKAEVIDTKLTVGEKVKNVEKKVEATAEQMANKVEANLSGIAQAIEKKKGILPIKESFLRRMLKFLPKKEGEKI